MRKHTIEFIRSDFEKAEYELLITEYINCFQKLEYICPNGHHHSISWAGWQQGHGCPYCVGNGKPTIEFIRSEFGKAGCELLTKEYINNHIKLDYICLDGHKHSITWSDWQQGKRCPYCAGNGKPTIEFIRLEFEKRNYKLSSEEYINSRQKLDYICPNGHKHSINWHDFRSGEGCPYCAAIASKGEIEVRTFIESFGIEILSNNRNQIFNPETGMGFELDIFMPEFNKALEYNGEYWHGNRNMEARDLLKQQLCEAKGIDLLTVWDKEWKASNKKCKNKIMKFIFSV